MTPQIERLKKWIAEERIITAKYNKHGKEELLETRLISDIEFLCNQIEKAYFIIANIYGYRAINKEIVEEWLRQYGEVEDETKD